MAGLQEKLVLDGISVQAVPAAHPNIETIGPGLSRFVGYVIEYKGYRIYHAGDTCVHRELIQRLQSFSGIDLAFIPVNEKNFYRDERGIIGNMSIRDAFDFASDIGVRNFVPVHWDMFELNKVYREEIELLYEKLGPDFVLTFDIGAMEIPHGC